MSASAGTVVNHPETLLTQQNFPQGLEWVYESGDHDYKAEKIVSAKMSAGLDIFRFVERQEEPS